MAAPVRRWFTAGLVVVALLGGGWLVVREARAWLGYRLPTEKILFDHEKPPSSIEVLDSEGLVLDYWAPAKHRLYRPLGQIDEKLPRWVVMLEDAKFFQHDGFDFEQIKNSVEENLEKGKIKRGASTITQQLAKNLFLDKDKTLLRKAFEVPWAIRLESDLSKKQILELYLNVIEWGPGVYGAEAAARHYFDRSANELTSGQAMYLALMIPNPKRMDLLQGDHARKELEQRRAQFVRRLVDEKKIEPEQESEYATADFGVVPVSATRNYPLFHEGKYLGRRDQRWQALVKLEGALRASAKQPVRTTLDRTIIRVLHGWAEVRSTTATKARFLVIKRGEAIVAFRWIPAKKSLEIPEGLPPDLAIEEKNEISWKSLLL